MNALQLAHAYLIGSTIHTPDGNRSPTKEEVIKAILTELNQPADDRRSSDRVRAYDYARDRRPAED